MYKKAEEGKITNLTGAQDPYEPPLNPEMIIDTESEAPQQCADRVLESLAELAYLPAVKVGSN